MEKPLGVAAAGGTFCQQGGTTVVPRHWLCLNQHYKFLIQDLGDAQGDSSSPGGEDQEAIGLIA